MMTKKITNYYTRFKAEAVREITDNNANISATMKQLCIAMQQNLPNWQKKLIKASLSIQNNIILNP